MRAGEIVLVTDRDEVVAELRPAREFQAPAPSEDTLITSRLALVEAARAFHRIAGVELLSADQRLLEAVRGV